MNKWISKFRYICPFISVPIKDAYGTVTCNQEYAGWMTGIAQPLLENRLSETNRV